MVFTDVATHHQLDHLRFCQIGHKVSAYQLAILKDRDIVTDLYDLVELMGNIDNRDILLFQALHDGEQCLNLSLGQGRCGLVHNDYLCLAGYGPHNLHHLAVCGAEIAHDIPRVDIGNFQAIHQPRCFLIQSLIVDQYAAVLRQIIQKDVFRHR